MRRLRRCREGRGRRRPPRATPRAEPQPTAAWGARGAQQQIALQVNRHAAPHTLEAQLRLGGEGRIGGAARFGGGKPASRPSPPAAPGPACCARPSQCSHNRRNPDTATVATAAHLGHAGDGVEPVLNRPAVGHGGVEAALEGFIAQARRAIRVAAQRAGRVLRLQLQRRQRRQRAAQGVACARGGGGRAGKRTARWRVAAYGGASPSCPSTSSQPSQPARKCREQVAAPVTMMRRGCGPRSSCRKRASTLRSKPSCRQAPTKPACACRGAPPAHGAGHEGHRRGWAVRRRSRASAASGEGPCSALATPAPRRRALSQRPSCRCSGPSGASQAFTSVRTFCGGAGRGRWVEARWVWSRDGWDAHPPKPAV